WGFVQPQLSYTEPGSKCGEGRNGRQHGFRIGEIKLNPLHNLGECKISDPIVRDDMHEHRTPLDPQTTFLFCPSAKCSALDKSTGSPHEMSKRGSDIRKSLPGRHSDCNGAGIDGGAIVTSAGLMQQRADAGRDHAFEGDRVVRHNRNRPGEVDEL